MITNLISKNFTCRFIQSDTNGLADKQKANQLIDCKYVDLHEKFAEWEAFYSSHRPLSAHSGKTSYEE